MSLNVVQAGCNSFKNRFLQMANWPFYNVCALRRKQYVQNATSSEILECLITLQLEIRFIKVLFYCSYLLFDVGKTPKCGTIGE